MRAGILSTALWSPGDVRETVRVEKAEIADREPKQAEWDLQEFEREQVRGLVQQLFFPGTDSPVRQVVFSAIETETDISPVCRQVAALVAAETRRDVAFVDERQTHAPNLTVCSESSLGEERELLGGPRASATQLASNLFWLHSRAEDSDRYGARPVHLYLEELRREFEYSIVAAPPAATSKKPLAMAHFADGIVLVLSAQRTRRVTALKVKNALGGVRLLGTVLCEREFPIPWGIYRRL